MFMFFALRYTRGVGEQDRPEVGEIMLCPFTALLGETPLATVAALAVFSKSSVIFFLWLDDEWLIVTCSDISMISLIFSTVSMEQITERPVCGLGPPLALWREYYPPSIS